MSVDMERYSRGDNRWQYEAQQTLQRVMWEAAESLGLARERWTAQPTGDGELAILPPDTPEPVVVTRLAPALDEILRDHNRHLVPAAQVRLRIAIHVGQVHLNGANGHPAADVNTVCRLVDAPPLKRAMAHFTEAGAGLIVSDQVYREVVVHYSENIRPSRFARVSVHLPGKEFRADAWILVPDEDVTTLPQASEAATEAGSPEQAPDHRAAPPASTAPSKVHIGQSTVHGTFVVGDSAQTTTAVWGVPPGPQA